MVYGGAGFIGSHLVDELLTRPTTEKILIIDDLRLGKLDNIKHHEGDKRVAFWKTTVQDTLTQLHGIIDTFEPNAIFNLAVDPLPKSIEYPREVWNNNIDSTWDIAQFCIHTNTRMIQFSSSEVYGTVLTGSINEHDELRPTTPYAASKAACDHLLNSLVQTHTLNVVTIRPFNTIGPRQNAGSYAGIIPATLKRIRQGNTPVIYGTGKQTRDFTYVTDIASAAIVIAKHGVTGEVYNACSGKETSIEWLIEEISEAMNYKGTVKYEMARIADVMRHQGDYTKLKHLSAWHPEVDIRSAVKRTVNWYKNEGG